MAKNKTVFVIQSLRLELSRSISRGIFRYAHTTSKPWKIYMHDYNMIWKDNRSSTSTLRAQSPFDQDWAKDVDGIIMPILSEEKMSILEPLADFKIVNTFGDHKIPPFPQVDVNNYRAGKVAAEYFLRKGFRSFMCLERPYTPNRCRGFQETLQSAGFNVQRFSMKGFRVDHPINRSILKTMMKAVKLIPKPLALYCEYDARARQIIPLLQKQELHVPNDVAVLGTQDDDLICESVFPSISSVHLPYDKIGYEAARIMDTLLQGKKPPSEPVLLDPRNVTERESTEILAIPNPNIKKALSYIKENALAPIKVSEIARASGLSLRVLQSQFRNSLGYSLQDEIRRIRIARAKELLKNPDLTLDEVAEQAGLNDKSYLIRVFRSATGLTPGNYRKQFNV